MKQVEVLCCPLLNPHGNGTSLYSKGHTSSNGSCSNRVSLLSGWCFQPITKNVPRFWWIHPQSNLWTFHPTKITWGTQALACCPQISPHLYPPQLFTWNQKISCSQLPGAYFQVNHVKHLGKGVKFPGIEPLPNTPRFTPRQWQSIPLLPACDWKTKPPQRWGFGGFAIITCLDLPRGAEWMIRAA